MTQCCDNQNEAKSQLCALAKIRGELLKVQNTSYLDIVDCQVSEWRPQEGSATCGGGTRMKSRSVLIQPQGEAWHAPHSTTESRATRTIARSIAYLAIVVVGRPALQTVVVV